MVSAYTTGMAEFSLPDYYNANLIKPEDLLTWNNDMLLRGYLIVNGDFDLNSQKILIILLSLVILIKLQLFTLLQVHVLSLLRNTF